MQHLSLEGLVFTHSRLTCSQCIYEGDYEAVSGGDFDFYRGGAVLVEDAENITERDCHFDASMLWSNIVKNNLSFNSVRETGKNYAVYISRMLLVLGH